jgi:large subunit ribosomal protein L10
MMEKKRASIIAKEKAVDELVHDMKKHKTLVLLDLRKTPNKLQQKVRKAVATKFGGKMRMASKAVANKAMEKAGLTGKIATIDYPVGIIVANDNPYNINMFFMENKLQVAAKAGEISPMDIIVPAGETELPPGPTLSQLKGAGVDVKIDKGKIVVSKDSKVVKTGDAITKEKASALQVLGIRPFKVGVKIAYAFDGYTWFSAEVLNMTPADIKMNLELALHQSLNASINASYPTQQSIKLLLTNVIRQARNAGINSCYYSESNVKDLLVGSIRQANAIPKPDGGSTG